MKVYAKLTLILLTVVLILSVVLIGRADVPNPDAYNIYPVEIQGAHQISEGGYLWFHLVNHYTLGFLVTVEFDSEFTPFNQTTSYAGTLASFTLNMNGTADLYFQAKPIYNGETLQVQSNSTWVHWKQCRLIFHLHPLVGESDGVHVDRVYFEVEIIPLSWKIVQPSTSPVTYFSSVLVLFYCMLAFSAGALLVWVTKTKHSGNKNNV